MVVDTHKNQQNKRSPSTSNMRINNLYSITLFISHSRSHHLASLSCFGPNLTGHPYQPWLHLPHTHTLTHYFMFGKIFVVAQQTFMVGHVLLAWLCFVALSPSLSPCVCVPCVFDLYIYFVAVKGLLKSSFEHWEKSPPTPQTQMKSKTTTNINSQETNISSHPAMLTTTRLCVYVCVVCAVCSQQQHKQTHGWEHGQAGWLLNEK